MWTLILFVATVVWPIAIGAFWVAIFAYCIYGLVRALMPKGVYFFKL